MSSEERKVKIYKNPNRGNSNFTAGHSYTPYYQAIGLEPDNYNGQDIPEGTKVASPQDMAENISRKREFNMQQPYATENEIVKSKQPTNSLPNIGNSVEQWFLVDNIDEPNQDQEYTMIDNNDWVDVPGSIDETPKDVNINNADPNKDYLLIYDNKIILVDNMESIQNLASEMVFGEHPLCNGKPISVNDIMVLKKIKLKIGLFLE